MRWILAVALQPRIILISLKPWRPLVATIIARYNILILVMTGVGHSIYLAGTRVRLEMQNHVLKVLVDVHLLVMDPRLHHVIPTTRSILVFGDMNAAVLLEILFITTTELLACTTCLHILHIFLFHSHWILCTSYSLLAILPPPFQLLFFGLSFFETFRTSVILCSG